MVLPLLVPDAPLVRLNGRCALVDTGSSHSFTSRPGEEFLGCRIEGALSEAVGEVTARLYQGHRPELLLGCDLLQRQSLLVDFKRQKMVLGAPVQGLLVKSERVVNFPVITLYHQEKPLRFLLDTGAGTGYLVKRPRGKPCGQVEDANPATGVFVSSVWRHELSLESEVFEAELGVLPKPLVPILSRIGLDGVIGADIFKRWAVFFAAGLGAIRLL